MRLISLFSALSAVVAVKAATDPSQTAAVETIVQEFKAGDFVGAAIDISTLGACDISSTTDCVGAIAPLTVSCSQAVVGQGANTADDLKCFTATLGALESSGFAKCAACLEEGIAIIQGLTQKN